MIDVVYIAATAGFFAVMLLYVRACARLGERDAHEEPSA